MYYKYIVGYTLAEIASEEGFKKYNPYAFMNKPSFYNRLLEKITRITKEMAGIIVEEGELTS
ncbi:MAG: hypothetical protein ACTSPN_16430 [Promethearchaeota archaeon]